MEKINQFSIQRFLLLIKRHVVINLKTWLVGFGAIGGLLILIALLQAYHSGGVFSVHLIFNTGMTFIFIGGYMVTSMAYNEIHAPARSQFFLTLPATTSEKLLSHWFLTSVIYIVLANLMLFAVLLLASLIAALVFGSAIDLFQPFTIENIRLMGIYIVTQSVFFLGAVYFRKNNLLKTILSVFVLLMVLGMWTGLAMWLAFGPDQRAISQEMVSPALANFMEYTVPDIARFLFWILLAPFLLIISYFKLKEREV